jgi:AraC-like DNA-binding protein
MKDFYIQNCSQHIQAPIEIKNYIKLFIAIQDCHLNYDKNELQLKQYQICVCNTFAKINSSGLKEGLILKIIFNPKHFHTDTLMAINEQQKDLSQVLALSQINGYIIFDSNKQVVDLIAQMQKVIASNTHHQNISLYLYLQLLFIEIINSNQKKMTNEKNLQNAILKEIEQEYLTITPDILSAKFHYNKRYLSYFMKKATGFSLKQIIIHKRLEYACQLIKTTNLSIDNIMQLSNFSNKNHFYLLFKEKYQVNPGALRLNIDL